MDYTEIVTPQEGTHRQRIWEEFFSVWQSRCILNPEEVLVKEVSEEDFLENRTELMEQLMKYDDSDLDDIEEEDSDEAEEDEPRDNAAFAKTNQQLIVMCERIDHINDCKENEDELVTQEPSMETDTEFDEEAKENPLKENNAGLVEYLRELDQDDINTILANDDHLFNLVQTIEVDLKSNIKEKLYTMMESKILCLSHFRQDLHATRKERRRLMHHLSREDITTYLKFLKNTSSLPQIVYFVENQLRSDLRLFLSLRNTASVLEQTKLNKFIMKEWDRLKGILPLRYLLVYAAAILEAINRNFI